MSIAPSRVDLMQALLAGTVYEGGDLLPLAGDASFRRYIRIRKGDKTAMMMDAPPDKEDVRPYIKAAEYLCLRGYSAPKILARDPKEGLLLLEDLGDDSFTRVLARDHNPQTMYALYAAAIDLLAEWHHEARGFSDAQAFPCANYDHTLLMNEIKLFSDWFLPQALGVDVSVALRPKFLEMWENMLLSVPLSTQHWVHRDYHADNLMWLPDRVGARRVGLLDFQDGVYGDRAYDLVSLLEDARRDVPHVLADAMVMRYISASGVDADRFRAAYALLGAQRNSKIIGIFVRLAVRDGKRGYLGHLPRVWHHLEHDISHPILAPLKTWLDTHIPPSARVALSPGV